MPGSPQTSDRRVRRRQGVLTQALPPAGAAVVDRTRSALAAAFRSLQDAKYSDRVAEVHAWPGCRLRGREPSLCALRCDSRRPAPRPGPSSSPGRGDVQWEFAAKHSAIWPATCARPTGAPGTTLDRPPPRPDRVSRLRPASTQRLRFGVVAGHAFPPSCTRADGLPRRSFALHGPIRTPPPLSPTRGQTARPGTRLPAGCPRSRPRRRAVGRLFGATRAQ